MSESEFETYLSLLGKLLHLSAKQRAQIADELRDHLEERFQTLLDQGVPREEALRLAVEELGDAAALAQQFTLPHHIRRRRQLMRYSLLTGTAIVVTFVMASFYWPASRPEPALQLQAQVAPKSPDVASKRVETTNAEESHETSARDDLAAKLDFRDFQLRLNDVPWPDAMEFLSEAVDLDILIDWRYAEEVGVARDTPVQLQARQGALSVRSAMELILEQVAGMELAYAIRDGVILISAPDNAYENRVYDCRDLLEGVVVHQWGGLGLTSGMSGGGFGGGGGGQGGGMFQVRAEAVGNLLLPTVAAQIGAAEVGGGLGGGGGIGFVQQPPAATSAAGPTLIAVIQEATAPAEWVSRDGSGGTITEYDGLLIVRHQPGVHHKIEELLQQIRTVRAQPIPNNQRGDAKRNAPVVPAKRDNTPTFQEQPESEELRPVVN
jgi:hypothetical protein